MSEYALTMTDARLAPYLTAASLKIRPGEIHAVTGDEAAVRALMRVAAGEIHPAAGSVDAPMGVCLLDDRLFSVPDLSLTDHLAARGWGARMGLVSRRKIRREAAALCEQYGWDVDMDGPVGRMSFSEKRQAVFLAALLSGAGLALFDAPLLWYAWREDREWARMAGALRERGVAALMSAGTAAQAMSADLWHALRNGRVETQQRKAAFDSDDEDAPLNKKDISLGGTVLTVRGLEAGGPDGAVRGLGLEVRGGEILCVACAPGNGGGTLADALAGLGRPGRPGRGRILLQGEDVSRWGARGRAALGLRYLPGPDRGRWLTGDATAADEALLREYLRPPIQDSGWLRLARGRRKADDLLARWGLEEMIDSQADMAGLPRDAIRHLALERETEEDMALLVAEHPGEGLSREERQAAWQRLVQARNARRAVVVISSDVREIMALGDRILVLRGGEAVAEMAADGATPMEIEYYMTGEGRQKRFGGQAEEDAEA